MSNDLFCNKYRIPTARAQWWNYKLSAPYFVTICTRAPLPQFGKIEQGEMMLNENGTIAHDEWMHTPEIRKNVELDAFIVMPNHIHGIIIINCRGVCNTPLRPDTDMGVCNTPQRKSPSQTIGSIVRGYKSSVTKKINELHNTNGSVVWQRNYWEHIIRDDRSFNTIAEYIINNPKNWDNDKLHSL